MSELRSNTISPRTTTAVNFTGLEVPSYLGQPLALDTDVVNTNTRIDNLNATSIPITDSGAHYAATNVETALSEIVTTIKGTMPTLSANDIATIFTTFFRVVHPTGGIIQGYWDTEPYGTLEMKGQTVNRSDYPDLWTFANTSGTAIVISEASWGASDKTMFSNGNGTTTFRLPDLRGLFLRSWDHSRGLDSGRGLATLQQDDLKAHTHDVNIPTNDGDHASPYTPPVLGQTDRVAIATNYPAAATSTGGAETRPKNVSLMTCIYY